MLKNIIDLLAIVPFYIKPTMPGCEGGQVDSGQGPLAAVDLRFLRLLRVFRTFKLSGYGAQLEVSCWRNVFAAGDDSGPGEQRDAYDVSHQSAHRGKCPLRPHRYLPRHINDPTERLPSIDSHPDIC
eukprot:scaffold634038_cov50-Prasinocladus_malaysianus.AAC.1